MFTDGLNGRDREFREFRVGLREAVKEQRQFRNSICGHDRKYRAFIGSLLSDTFR